MNFNKKPKRTKKIKFLIKLHLKTRLILFMNFYQSQKHNYSPSNSKLCLSEDGFKQ